MEIPYTNTARPDTGLYNAKVGIWLFLASEVMLFGALFSGYILLRIGADPGAWLYSPLDVIIGTVNTIVLITSSLTVLQAWASLKMNNLKRCQFYLAATVACAAAFIVIKSFEYKDKFTHYQIWLTDGRTMSGHIEGTPWFWNTETLEQRNIETLLFSPDPPEKQIPQNPGSMEEPTARVSEVLYAAAAEQAHDGTEASESHGEGDDHGHGDHQVYEIPRNDIQRLSALVPAHSTYFAIYFTMTGLHALHVVGGALVLAYFLFFGAPMWRSDPVRLTNRIEVGGLFWHFVDLVWIFLFPLLYLL